MCLRLLVFALFPVNMRAAREILTVGGTEATPLPLAALPQLAFISGESSLDSLTSFDSRFDRAPVRHSQALRIGLIFDRSATRKQGKLTVCRQVVEVDGRRLLAGSWREQANS